MLKHFTEDTGQVYWPIICWFSFTPLFKDRGYIGLFPDRWESSCGKGFLADQFEDRSKFFVKGLKDYRLKLVWASSFMGVKPLSNFSMPLEETCISGILGCGLGLKEEFMSGSCWGGRGRGFDRIL